MSYNYKDILAELRRQGYKITPQRRAIIQIMDSYSIFLTPQEILNKTHNHPGKFSLVTIYRTLTMLEKAGLVCRLNNEFDGASYSLRRTHNHHHHLVCSDCRLAVNIEDCNLEELEKRVSKNTNFIVDSHMLEFSGICPECQAKREQSDGRKQIS